MRPLHLHSAAETSPRQGESPVAYHLSSERRVQILRLLTEGNSVRSTARLVGSEIRTVLRHLLIAGDTCRAFLDQTQRRLSLRHVEIDEIWTFTAKKEKR